MSINVCNDRSMASITSLPSGVSGGSLVLISTVTASSSSTVTFDSGIDSTYKEYQIHIIQAHCSSDNQILQVGFRDGSTAYDATKTTTYFASQHKEDASGGAVGYNTDQDQAQATGLQSLGQPNNNDDASISGTLHLFDPSNSTFVKHFIARANLNESSTQSDNFIAGYINTATAITRVQFKSSSGTLDSGVIKLYGVS